MDTLFFPVDSFLNVQPLGLDEVKSVWAKFWAVKKLKQLN